MYALYSAGTEMDINVSILCHVKYYSDLIEKGVNPSSIVSYDPNHSSLIGEFVHKDWRKSLHVIAKISPISCLVMNPHPGNPIFFADYARIVGGTRFLWLHEPHKTLSELLKFGFFKGLYYFIASLTARWSVKHIEYCLLPSKYALNRFKTFYPYMASKCFLLPLMFPRIDAVCKEKLYFSFVGTVNEGKGIDPFLGLVEYCLKQNLKFQFKIISSNLSEPWLSRANKCKGINLEIITKDNITDLEIAESISSSFAVLCLYLTVTQSAVVANAMMQGTPVIASQVGSLTEVIIDGKTGYFVQDLYDHANNVKLLDLCIARHDYHKIYCIEEFQKSYSVEALKPYLSQIISLTK